MSIATLEIAQSRSQEIVKSPVIHKFNLPPLKDEDRFNQIFKDFMSMPEKFIYGGTSVHDKYHGDFDGIEVLDRLNSDNLIDKTNDLKERIRINFLKYLRDSLGEERSELLPEIHYYFSQTGMVMMMAEWTRFTKKYMGKVNLGNPDPRDRITLHIPPNSNEVKIEFRCYNTFDQYHDQTDAMKIYGRTVPLKVDARGVYTLRPGKPVRGKAVFNYYK